jgi:hypothetical protein
MPIDQTDFATTWGREFATSIADVVRASGQDGYEAYVVAFGTGPTLSSLQRLAPEQITQLRDAARTVLETPAIEDEHMAEAVRWTIEHYS